MYCDVVRRFGAASELPLGERAAKTLFDKGVALNTLSRSEDAIGVFDDLIARFGAATEAPLYELVAHAKFARDSLRKC